MSRNKYRNFSYFQKINFPYKGQNQAVGILENIEYTNYKQFYEFILKVKR